ncbi:hypothetical protein [Winogradskyella forsetii]|uniref:hypothetical protein n=1 Tax=Winogradskyella forsetii TaxID=2686077 RepID=UPI0015BA30FA|nr:hypothetical protein [Winogradskyella forsetii]
MKKLLPIIFSLLIIVSCKQKNESEKQEDLTEFNERNKEPIIEITDSDYYNFLNDVLEDKTIIESKILKYPDLKNNSDYWREILTPLTRTSSDEKMSEILTDSDIEYIFNQSSTERKLKLDFDKLKLDNVTDEVLKNVSDYLQSEDRTNQKKYDYFGIYNLTIPIFSKNKKYAFFDNSFYCGLLCAYDGIDVYEFKNGKWESIGSIGIMTMS